MEIKEASREKAVKCFLGFRLGAGALNPGIMRSPDTYSLYLAAGKGSVYSGSKLPRRLPEGPEQCGGKERLPQLHSGQ